MQTIKTKYHGATNTKPSKMIAVASGYHRGWPMGRITIPYEHGVDSATNHRVVCEALREQLGWTTKNGHGAMVGGATTDGMVWVSVDDVKTEN